MLKCTANPHSQPQSGCESQWQWQATASLSCLPVQPSLEVVMFLLLLPAQLLYLPRCISQSALSSIQLSLQQQQQ